MTMSMSPTSMPSSATFLLYQTVPTVSGPVHQVMRAPYNAAPPDGRPFPARPGQPRLSWILRPHQPDPCPMMNDTSVLGRYLWVFRRIVGRMQHDLFHAYTVDQHPDGAAKRAPFFVAEHAHEYAYCSELAWRFERPGCAHRRALPRHGQGPGRRPLGLGAEEVRRFCRNTACRPGRRAGRVPGARAPHHETRSPRSRTSPTPTSSPGSWPRWETPGTSRRCTC